MMHPVESMCTIRVSPSFLEIHQELYRQVDTRKLDLIQVYQHIVLLVQHFGKFGAFGISRWPEFMSKDLKFDRLCMDCKPWSSNTLLKQEINMCFVRILKGFLSCKSQGLVSLFTNFQMIVELLQYV